MAKFWGTISDFFRQICLGCFKTQFQQLGFCYTLNLDLLENKKIFSRDM